MKKIPNTRFRTIGISQIHNVPEFIGKYVYIINHGRGQDVKKPIAISLPYRLYELIPSVMELLTLLVNYGETLSILERRKYNTQDQKMNLEELIKKSKNDILALQQVIMDESQRALENLQG